MGRWWRYKWITFHPSLTIVYSFSDFFQGVPDSTFFSAVIMLLVIGTIVARHLDRKKSLKNTSQI
ncbi:hypothetical protein EFJ52_21575 [Escherichia coli]|nr:hypothetical protein [Escherichia coli]